MYLQSNIVSILYIAFGLINSIFVNGVFGVPNSTGSNKDMWNTGWIFIVSSNFNR